MSAKGSGRRILVTGGAGFIGAQLIRWWLTAHPEDEIVNLDRLTYAGAGEGLDGLPASGYRFIRGDVGDRDVVERAMERCEAVVHLAAETHVDRSITDAAPFLSTNVQGTYTVLQAAHAAGIRRVLHVSTDEVYGPVLTGAADEEAPLRPRNLYAASKASGDLLAQAFHRTHGVPVIVVRPTNIYGPGQLPEKFIPLSITNTLDGLPIPIYGDGAQRRGWLFVTDLCAALECLLDRGEVGKIYNIGSGTEQANLETARRILELLGAAPERLQFVADRPAHDRRYAMDDAKLRALGWQPRVSFERGLAETVAWYRSHEAWWRPLASRLREDPYHWLNRAVRTGIVPQPEPHR